MVKETGSYRPVEPVKPEIGVWPIRQAVCGEEVVPAGFTGKTGSTQKAARFWSDRGSANWNDTASFCGKGKKKIGRSLKSKTLNLLGASSSFVCCCWRPPTSFRATTSPAILPPLPDRRILLERRPRARRSSLFSTGEAATGTRLPPLLKAAPPLFQAVPPLFRHYSAAALARVSGTGTRLPPCSRRHGGSRYGWTANIFPHL
ncbi:unnamed protein product [Linum trigynum]|uniref:Uncharacterized protein n=1 Tax=Linum trigynum TaxID=586398 RepID=A0AAV2C9T8_9ROSI